MVRGAAGQSRETARGFIRARGPVAERRSGGAGRRRRTERPPATSCFSGSTSTATSTSRTSPISKTSCGTEPFRSGDPAARGGAAGQSGRRLLLASPGRLRPRPRPRGLRRSRRLLAGRNLPPRPAGLGEADGDGLLAALHRLARAPALQLATLHLVHGPAHLGGRLVPVL